MEADSSLRNKEKSSDEETLQARVMDAFETVGHRLGVFETYAVLQDAICIETNKTHFGHLLCV